MYVVILLCWCIVRSSRLIHLCFYFTVDLKCTLFHVFIHRFWPKSPFPPSHSCPQRQYRFYIACRKQRSFTYFINVFALPNVYVYSYFCFGGAVYIGIYRVILLTTDRKCELSIFTHSTRCQLLRSLTQKSVFSFFNIFFKLKINYRYYVHHWLSVYCIF